MIDKDAEQQTHHQQHLAEQAHTTTHHNPALSPDDSQLQMNASAACTTKLGRQQHSHPIAGPTDATASQLATSHAPHTAQLIAPSGQANASHEASTSSVAVPYMHGTKRSASTTGSDSGLADVSHRAKLHRREPRHSTQLATLALQQQTSQEGMSLAAPQQEPGLDDSCHKHTVGAVFR